MGDPSSYVTAKIASAVGGLIGGLVLMSFIQPKSVVEAFVRGGISVGSAIIFANPLLTWIDVPSNWELQLMSGTVVGFCAYFILGTLANFFVKNQREDLLTVIKKAKSSEPAEKTKPRTRTRTRSK